MTRAYETLRYDMAENGVLTIALDQPETRNALSEPLTLELIDAFEAARDDLAVHCVVLSSTHPRTFSAGGNLGGMAADVSLIDKFEMNKRFPTLFTLIAELGKPVLCAVDGHCLAGAFGLALACDLIIASDKATFGTPEINVGVFPFMIAVLLYRNLPRKKASELIMLGERITAEQAEALGIVNRVVPQETFAAAVQEWAAALASKSPLLMKLGKDALWRQSDLGAEDAWDYLAGQLTLAFSTNDMKEGVAAFFAKRDPVWTNT
jgi:enoyl-CoA hydratase